MNMKKLTTIAITAAIAISTTAVISSTRAAANTDAVSYSDISSHWSKTTIEWATKQKIANGYQDGTFKPDGTVTEAEFLAMLIRSCKPEMTGGQGSHWADAYYQIAKQYNYPISGLSDIDQRNKPINRLAVAGLISASQGVNYSGDDAIRYLYGQKLANGSDAQPTINGYKGADTLTRAEAVQFIKNLKEHGKGELLTRPEEPSDETLLAYIPIGDSAQTTTGTNKPNYDLPYQPLPKGWEPPTIKSTATDDKHKNWDILNNELGMYKIGAGVSYNPIAPIVLGNPAIIVGATESDGYDALITLKYWMGSEKQPYNNEIPYIMREVIKFYLGSENGLKLFSILDDGFNSKDVSNYMNTPFNLGDRQVKIMDTGRGVTVMISKSGQTLN